MSKSDTIDALLGSAVLAFSKDGYEGASLRDIARSAGVPLSTIHFYFKSKSELYLAVLRQAWNVIDEDRSAHLAAALAAHRGGPALLEAVIRAVAYPVVRRALSDCEREVAQIHIFRAHIPHWRSTTGGKLLEVADRSMIRWIDAIMRCCPSLSRQDTVWAFSFVIGAVYSWQLVDHRYDAMLGAEENRSADAVTDDIVAFCCGGIEAIAGQRAAASALSRRAAAKASPQLVSLGSPN